MLRGEHLSALWPLFAFLIATGLWFGVKAGGDGLLKNPAAPSGIGSLERAGSVAEASKIISSWDQKAPDERTRSQMEKPSLLFNLISNDGRVLTSVARRSLVFDLFFIIFYTTALAVACLLAATEIAIRTRKRTGSRLVRFGLRLAYLQVVSAAVDVLENVAVWRMLAPSTLGLWPILAYFCSIAKLVLVSISLIYVLLAFVFWLVDARHTPKRRVKVAPA